VKRRDLERHLRDHGCREVGGSKHAKWRGPNGEVSAVPRHKEIGASDMRAAPSAGTAESALTVLAALVIF
jgi:hypothetical protein